MALDTFCGIVVFFLFVGVYVDLLTRTDGTKPPSLLRLLSGKK